MSDILHSDLTLDLAPSYHCEKSAQWSILRSIPPLGQGAKTYVEIGVQISKYPPKPTGHIINLVSLWLNPRNDCSHTMTPNV